LLAYVFWHVPRPGIAARDYESAHREFHDVLWKSKVSGLVGLRVFRLPAKPWLGGKPGYEDWHLLENSTGLDVLNGAAISQARQLPHDRIAAMAADGTAGLYGLRMGSMNDVSHAWWLSKPAGKSYRDFDASLKLDIDAGACLWGRRMTLGPTPEFCLHAAVERRPVHDALSIAMSPVLEFRRDQSN
jgi:hypothetical protein